MPECDLDEFLTEHAASVQQGADTAVTDFIPSPGDYTTTLLPVRFTTGKDKKTGSPIGYLILPHKILEGADTGQVFEWMGSISNGFFFGALKRLAKLLDITTQDPRAMVGEIVTQIAERAPTMMTNVNHYVNPTTGKVSGNYRHDRLVGI